jgi:hypothetical protein
MSRRMFIPSEGHSQRKQLADWHFVFFCQQDVDLWVTLNFNQERSKNAVRHQFRELLARVDREHLGPRWCRKHADERTFAIGVIENPQSNIHVHALWRMPARVRTSSHGAQAHCIKAHWHKLQPAGSCFIRPIEDLGAARYMSKQLHQPGHIEDCVFFSTEFHNRD